jgi:hypothetical protein
MSDFPDDLLDPIDPQDTPPKGSTRPIMDDDPLSQSSQSRSRRRYEDVPPARPTANTPPRMSRPVEDPPPLRPRTPPPPRVTLPDTEPEYDSREEARLRRAERRAQENAAARAAVNKRESGLYLPWWSLIIMLVFVGGAALGAWLVVDQLGGNAPVGGQTPIVVVVTSTYTVGPPPSLTPIPQPATITAPAALPTVAPTGTLPPGDFVIGATVEVVGVGIGGLNVRASPGTDAVIRLRAFDTERFVLREGPQQASGLEWWRIEDPTDSTRTGWAARNFLTVVNP